MMQIRIMLLQPRGQMEQNVRRSIQRVRTLGFIAVLVLSGCYEADDETIPAASDGQPTPDNAVFTEYWLDAAGDEDPVAFAARVTGVGADRITPGFGRAAVLYRESPRMIANRVVQLWQEIKQKDDGEIDIEILLDDLTMIDSSAENSLGSVIHRYRVLRAQGQNHPTAVARATGDAP
jgi:hypothetical protein